MQQAPLRHQRVGWQRLALVVLLLSALTFALIPPTAASGQTFSVPTEREQCFRGGWQDFDLGFRNQGQCVSYVATNARHFTEIKLLATNDFHGRIGNGPLLSAHLNAIKDAHPDTLHVDAGDLVGATPVTSNLFRDEPTVEVMNAMGMDVQTVGNHEFDAGQDEVLRRRDGGCYEGDCDYRDGLPFEGQDFVTLSSNVIVDDTGEALTQPYHIEEVGGVDIGFIGVTTVDTPNVVHPDGIVGLTFLPEAEAVNSTVPDVQAAGADVIVVLMHEGGRQDGDMNSCDNFRGATAGIHPQFDDAVDVVVDGHTHESYVCDLEDGPLVTQAYEYGKMFTEISLVFDHRRGGEIVARTAQNHLVTDDVEPDADVQEIVDFYEELAGPLMEEVVGHSTVEIPRTTREAESKQGNLATDALLDQHDVDFAFQNSGGLRADLTTEADDDGLYPITRGDVLEVWPFGNVTVLAEIDGEMLEAWLANGVQEIGGGRFIQVGGLRIDYEIADPDADPFPRGEIVNVEYWNHPDHDDGTSVDLSANATYTIATNDFMAAGGDGYPVITDDIYSQAQSLEIDVENYLKANSPVSPEVEGRIVDVTAQ